MFKFGLFFGLTVAIGLGRERLARPSRLWLGSMVRLILKRSTRVCMPFSASPPWSLELPRSALFPL